MSRPTQPAPQGRDTKGPSVPHRRTFSLKEGRSASVPTPDTRRLARDFREVPILLQKSVEIGLGA
jgi:hypothetical protein